MADRLAALAPGRKERPLRAAPPRTSLMELIAERRRDLGILQKTLARQLDVRQSVVSSWERGHTSPKVACVVAYAHLLGWRLVLHNGHTVLGRAAGIPHALRYLRRAYGLTRQDLAAILHVQQATVAMWENRGCALLDTTETWASGLGLHIGVGSLDGVLVLDDQAHSGRRAA